MTGRQSPASATLASWPAPGPTPTASPASPTPNRGPALAARPPLGTPTQGVPGQDLTPLLWLAPTPLAG
ncbi:hypothetical protein OS965_41775, partial [Streptomyces sp. H27-G5]|nr:hypothetical protein [Streptomyces sp. H27-G5]